MVARKSFGEWGFHDYTEYSIEPTMNSVKHSAELIQGNWAETELCKKLKETLIAMENDIKSYKPIHKGGYGVDIEMILHERLDGKDLRLFTICGRSGHVIIGIVFDISYQGIVSCKMGNFVRGELSPSVSLAIGVAHPVSRFPQKEIK